MRTFRNKRFEKDANATLIGLIRRHYIALKHNFGRQHWWPARNRMEMVLGAYLVQNTAWSNAARALRNLRKINAFSLSALREISEEELSLLIRSSGYFRQKVQRIEEFIRFVDAQHSGSLRKLFRKRSPLEVLDLRKELLQLQGVGKETADSILLYAGNYPVFVIDAYARRIFARHGLFGSKTPYDEMRVLVERALQTPALQFGAEKRTGHYPSCLSAAKRDKVTQHLNEFHALLVQVGKQYCHRSNPSCEFCPLRKFLPKVQ